MKIRKLFYILLVFPLLVSCMNEDDASNVVVVVAPDKKGDVYAASNIRFDISAFTLNDYIKELSVYTLDTEGETLNYRINPNVPKYSETYYYKVPQVSKENTEIKIYVEAIDNLNNKCRFALKYNVLGSELKELSAIELNSPLSGYNDGINIETKTSIRRSQLTLNDELNSFWLKQFTDEEKLQQIDYLPLEFNTSQIESRISFAINNSFNYAEATTTSLKSAYSASISNNYISNIKIGDIILIGVDNEGWGVMKVLYIIDEEGYVNDKMIINIKTIE